MNRFFKSILAAAVSAFAFVGCTEYNPTLLGDEMAVISTEKLSFDTDGAEKTVTVKLEGDWIAVLPVECDWLTVDPSYGTGETEVKIVAAPNRDGVGAIAGPRSSMVNFTTSAGSAVLNVSQMGDITKLSAKTYKPVTEVTPGASYLLVAKNGNELYAGTPVPTSSNYAYLLKKDVTANVQADGSIVMPDGSYGFTFEAAGESGQYIIRQADGEALWQAASYNNFYTDVTPSEGYIWTVEPQSDGTVIIKSVDLGKWLQYSITYSSYGGYSSAQDNALLPYLYENADKVLVVDNSIINLTDGDLEEEFTIVCESELVDVVIPEDCDWITLVSKVTDGVKTTLTFKSKNNPDLASRTVSILIGSVDATVNVSITQPARAITPDDIIDCTVAEFNAAEPSEMLYRITASVSKISSASKGRFYIYDFSGETYVYNMSGFEESGVKEGDIVTIVGNRDQYNTTIEMTSAYIENVIPVSELSISEFLSKEVNTTDWYMVTGTVTSIASDTYGNLYINDGESELYVYGTYSGYGASGDAKKGLIAAKGIEVGDNLTVIGNRGEYKGAAQMVNGFYFSHTKKPAETEVLTINSDNLPTAYPTTETTATLNGVQFDIYNVANFGSGMQFKKGGSYLQTHADFDKKIKTIKLTVTDGKTWFPTNLTLSCGSTVIEASSDDTSSTYDLSGGDYKSFKITNASNYAVYVGTIEITFAE